MGVKFECVGCGKCCEGRFLPLTFDESLDWLRRGHEVVIMLEAFDHTNWPANSPTYEHHLRRSALVSSGSGSAQAIAIFAGNNLSTCPNLQADNTCGIYDQRPLVCRIYPREINPFITLSPAAKECPPESWIQEDSADLEDTDASKFDALIFRSRTADHKDAELKLAVCESLGFKQAGWKGNGLIVYRPSIESLLGTMESCQARASAPHPSKWTFISSTEDLCQRLLARGLAVQATVEPSALFLPLLAKH